MARSGGEDSYVNGIPIVSWPPKQQLCHYCNSTAASLLFCIHHSAFICLNCDAKLHDAAAVTDHHRFPVCQLCERAPAALTCKADAASLCVHCDAEIHNANPLSRRHERVSISPLPAATEPTMMSFDVGDFMVPTDQWIDSKLALCPNQVKTEDIFFPDFIDDFNPLLDLDVILKQETISCCSDGVVPTDHHTNNNVSFDHIDFEKPNFPIYDQQPVAVISPIQTVQSTSPTVPALISSSLISDRVTTGSDRVRDREARVLRYKEKKKNRKFEKTVRYASRKAYAETRPRIKGRFAKRNNDPDNDDIFPDLFFPPHPTFFDDLIDYGVVPSF